MLREEKYKGCIGCFWKGYTKLIQCPDCLGILVMLPEIKKEKETNVTRREEVRRVSIFCPVCRVVLGYPYEKCPICGIEFKIEKSKKHILGYCIACGANLVRSGERHMRACPKCGWSTLGECTKHGIKEILLPDWSRPVCPQCLAEYCAGE